MSQSNPTKSGPEVKNENTVPRRDYDEDLARAQCWEGYFMLRRDFVNSRVFTKIEALFLCDLINMVGMKGTKKLVSRDDGSTYFRCNESSLLSSLSWGEDSQASLLRELKKRGYLKYVRKGLPPMRWVCLDMKKIEDSVKEALEKGPPEIKRRPERKKKQKLAAESPQKPGERSPGQSPQKSGEQPRQKSGDPIQSESTIENCSTARPPSAAAPPRSVGVEGDLAEGPQEAAQGIKEAVGSPHGSPTAPRASYEQQRASLHGPKGAAPHGKVKREVQGGSLIPKEAAPRTEGGNKSIPSDKLPTRPGKKKEETAPPLAPLGSEGPFMDEEGWEEQDISHRVGSLRSPPEQGEDEQECSSHKEAPAAPEVSVKEGPDQLAERWTRELNGCLLAKGLLSIKGKSAVWKKEWLGLLKEVEDQALVEKVFQWYRKNVGGFMVPEALSAGGFRKKFDAIRGAMRRQKKAAREQDGEGGEEHESGGNCF